MKLFKRAALLLTILLAVSAFTPKQAKVYELSGADRVIIGSVETGPYWEKYEIIRQRKEAGKLIYIPLKFEEFDTDTGKLKTVKDVSFAAIDDPVFDPKSGEMTYAQKDGYTATYAYEYRLVKNLFRLLEVTKTEFTNCDEKTGECKDTKDTVIFKAKDRNAQAH